MKIRKHKVIQKTLLILLIFMVTFMVSCSSNKEKLLKDYPSLETSEHLFKSITVSKVQKKFKNQESFYLVMGFPECPWCQALMPILNQVATFNDVEEIFYLDIKKIRDNKLATGYKTFEKLTSTYLKETIDPEKNRINAPTFITVDKGVVVSYHLNTVESHVINEEGTLPDLTKAQVRELVDILNKMFNIVIK